VLATNSNLLPCFPALFFPSGFNCNRTPGIRPKFTAVRTVREIAKITSTQTEACFISPASQNKLRLGLSAFVLEYFQLTSGWHHSPKARAKRERFQQQPGQDSGRMTRQNTVASDAPRVRQPEELASICSKLPVLFIHQRKGNHCGCNHRCRPRENDCHS